MDLDDADQNTSSIVEISPSTLESLRQLRDSSPSLKWWWQDASPKKALDSQQPADENPFNWVGVEFTPDGEAFSLSMVGFKRLDSLPKEIEVMGPFVKELDLERCTQLESIPDEISGLKKLKRLKLTKCASLDSLPNSIGSLLRLEVLDLNKCTALASLPDSVDHLNRLKKLDVRGCKKLRSLPFRLWQRFESDKLKLETSLVHPDCLLALRSLRDADPELTAIWKNSTPTGDVGKADVDVNRRYWKRVVFNEKHRVEALDLSGVTMMDVPHVVAGLLHLQTIRFVGCTQLTEVAPEIGHLPNLKTLDLADCSALCELPTELSLAPELQELKLYGCSQLTFPPQEIHPDTSQCKDFLIIAEQMKDNPDELITAMESKDPMLWLVVKCMFERPTFARVLYRATKLSPATIVETKSPDGLSFFELCRDETCREAVRRAGLFLGEYEVGNIVHRSSDTIVFMATNDEGNTVLVKAMRTLDRVLSEVNGRGGTKAQQGVVQLTDAYRDASVIFMSSAEEKKDEDGAFQDSCDILEDAIDLADDMQRLLKFADGPMASSDISDLLHSDPPFQFAMILEHVEGETLSDLMNRGYFSGPRRLDTARMFFTSMFQILKGIHQRGFIHGDLEPCNIILSDGKWKLLDFDSSCAIGTKFSRFDKINGGYCCTPELARSLSMSRQKGEDPIYEAREAHDFWSLGCLLFQLISGQPLVPPRSRGIVSSRDLSLLSNWSFDAFFDQVQDIMDSPSSWVNDIKLGLDFSRRLLHPDADIRSSFNPFDHPFFQEKPLDPKDEVNDTKVVNAFMSSIEPMFDMSLSNAKSKADDKRRYLKQTSWLNRRQLLEFNRFRGSLFIGASEAALSSSSVDRPIPTSFVLTTERLPTDAKDEDSTLKLETVAKARLDECGAWLEWSQTLMGTRIIDDNAHLTFKALKKSLKNVVSKDVLYFYPVDELSGTPQSGKNYPLELSTTSDTYYKIIPLMFATMHTVAKSRGIMGLLKLFCYPLTTLPDKQSKKLKRMVESLKSDKAAKLFHDDLGHMSQGMKENLKTRPKSSSHKDAGLAGSIRSESLLALRAFLKENDDVSGYAGLNRCEDEIGNGFWTAITAPEQVRDTIQQRLEEFHAEEQATASVQEQRKRSLLEAEAELEKLKEELFKTKFELNGVKERYLLAQRLLDSAKPSDLIATPAACCGTL